MPKKFYQTVFETVKKPTFFLIDERTKPSVPVALLPSQSHIIVLTSFVKIDYIDRASKPSQPISSLL